MLKITKNSINNLYVTVTENTTLDPAYYLMSLYSNDNTDARVVRFSGDSSTNTQRWNIFTLEEISAANEDLESAKINLIAGGSYDYVIYETSAATGTSIVNAGVVEKGLLKVEGAATSGSTFTDSNNVVTFI